MFHFNDLRPEIVAEVTRRVVQLRQSAAATRIEEQLAYVLNELVMHETKRLRHVKPPDTEEDRRRVQELGRALGRGAGDDELMPLLERQVRSYADDIAGTFSVSAYKVASQVLPSVLSLLMTPQNLSQGLLHLGSLQNRVRIEGDLVQLRHLAAKGTLVVVPTHLSNLDSPLIAFALEQAQLPPMTYGAGKNLFTSPLTSFFMRRLGAYKVDRRLKFGLYKEVLKSFSQVVLERGLHSIFFPGGTRSRSGAVERKLKLGLAGTALTAYIENLKQHGPDARRCYFVPVTLNMPLVLEAETLIADHLEEVGKNRYIIEDDEFSRLGRVATFVKKLLTMDAAIEVRFGQARDPFGNHVDEVGGSHDRRGHAVDPMRYVLRHGAPEHHRGRDEEYTRELGTLIADDFLAGTSVFATHIVAHALMQHLEKQLPGADVFQRLRHPREQSIHVMDLASRVERVRDAVMAGAARGLGKLAERASSQDGRALIDDALASFAGYHTRPAAERRGDTVVLTDRELLLYYKNRLAHHRPAHEVLS
jgi:glycerol-3-phosphate O-acyltransferase